MQAVIAQYHVRVCENKDGGKSPLFHGRLAVAGIPLIYEESD